MTTIACALTHVLTAASLLFGAAACRTASNGSGGGTAPSAIAPPARAAQPTVEDAGRTVRDGCALLLAPQPGDAAPSGGQGWAPGVGGIGATLSNGVVVGGDATEAGAGGGPGRGSVTIDARAIGLSNDVVQRILVSTSGGIRACYSCGLATDPGLAGSLQERLEVGSAGEVTRVLRSVAQLPANDVAACVERALGRLAFPSPNGGHAEITVRVQLDP